MGQTSLDELEMEFYPKDSSAAAVVLYDQGNLYTYDNNLNGFRTDYYFRIKILKKEGLNKATIRIPFFNNSQQNQEIKNIKAITYNSENGSITKKQLSKNSINTIQISNTWKEINFALPDVKVGSVIEYSYTKVNPFLLEIDDWYFQDDIPKIKSEYHSSIVGNYQYNAKLNGYFKLSKNNPSVKKRCVTFTGDGYSKLTGDCNVLDFAMTNVPAFTKEKYLTSKENYISKVSFQLQSIFYSNGKKDQFTDTWRGTDRKLKSGIFFGSEIKKVSYFKNKIPKEVLNITEALTRAKKIYYYLQQHFTDNRNGYNFQKINTKRAFEEKSGTVPEINMSLYNALKAAKLDAFIVLASTRSKGEPTKLYPVINDFNYLLVKTTINGKDYFLDASKKYLPFGLTPYETLNGEVRVMDFKKGSYWQLLNPSEISVTNTLTNISISNEGKINSKLRIVKKGYDAISLRSELHSTSQNDYLESYESKNDFTINDYKEKGLDNKEASVTQTFNITLDDENTTLNKIDLDVFFFDKITSNPFKLETRFYPVNFGYKLNKSFRANIKLPDNYIVTSIPKSKAFTLPNNGGKFLFNCKKIGQKIIVVFKYELNKVEYTNEEYFALKEFFSQIIKTQSSLINLERK
jgi:hypothetical protein